MIPFTIDKNDLLVTVTLNTALDVVVPVKRWRPGAVHRLERPFRVSAGGKGLNVARAARCLGERPRALCLLGGSIGRGVQALLEEENMPADVMWISGRTRMSVFIVETGGARTARLMEPGPLFSKEERTRLWRFLDRHRPVSGVMIFSGRLPPGLPDDFYARCVRRYQNRRRFVVIDTSGAALKHSLAARPFMIKPNLAEAEELLGDRLPTAVKQAGAVRRLVRMGAGIVWLTMGRRGAWVGTRGGLWRVHAPEKLGGVHPVGCGDALTAGFWVARRQGWDWETQLRFAVACGTVAAGFETPGRLDAAAVERLLPRVRIKPWSGAWRV